MMNKPSLLMLTAATAALSTVAHGYSAVTTPAPVPETRLGVSIKQEMGVRNQAAIERDRTLDMREKAIRATEQRLQSSLKERQDQAASDAAGRGARDENQFDELARIYQAMKPAKAAMVFEQLEMDVQMEVAQRMRDRAAALMLANMTPKGAAALSMSLARQRPIDRRAAAKSDNAESDDTPRER